MIIFPSFTATMFSLKPAFALFRVCLLHFYVFVTDSAQTLCQLSKALLKIFRCLFCLFVFFFFFDFILLQKALPEPLACSLLLFYSLHLVHSCHPGIFLHHQPRGSPCFTTVSLLPWPLTPFFLVSLPFLGGMLPSVAS